VAPGVELYYWAEPSWKRDYKYRTKALLEIIDFNLDKPQADRIRVVSISKGFDDKEPNLEDWKKTIMLAEESGIYVVHCSTNMHGVSVELNEDRNDFSKYKMCYFMNGQRLGKDGLIYAPIDNRTYASWQREDAYEFRSRGGLSWGAPYIAGVVALGLQIDPSLSVGDLRSLLYESGFKFNGGRLIIPKSFIAVIQEGRSTEQTLEADLAP
jgi:serine protease AprX